MFGANYLVTMHDAPRHPSIAVGSRTPPGASGWRGTGDAADRVAGCPDRQLYPDHSTRLKQNWNDWEMQFSSGEKESVILNKLLTAKSSSLRLQRIPTPQRELLGRLSTGEYTVIPAHVRL